MAYGLSAVSLLLDGNAVMAAIATATALAFRELLKWLDEDD